MNFGYFHLVWLFFPVLAFFWPSFGIFYLFSSICSHDFAKTLASPQMRAGDGSTGDDNIFKARLRHRFKKLPIFQTTRIVLSKLCHWLYQYHRCARPKQSVF